MATVDRLELIKKDVDKASNILNAISCVELKAAKFMNRRDRIVNELNAFSEAIQRQIIPSKIRLARIASLEAEILRLKQETEN